MTTNQSQRRTPLSQVGGGTCGQGAAMCNLRWSFTEAWVSNETHD